MKKTLMAGLFALTTAAASVALAMPGMDGDMRKHHDRHMERIATELELTAEQQEQLRTVHEEHFEKMKALHEDKQERVEAILTAEQRQKMQELHEEKREKMKKHMEQRKERNSDKRDATSTTDAS